MNSPPYTRQSYLGLGILLTILVICMILFTLWQFGIIFKSASVADTDDGSAKMPIPTTTPYIPIPTTLMPIPTTPYMPFPTSDIKSTPIISS